MFGLNKLFKSKTDFKSIMKNGAVLIDVRTAAEFAEGHIPGSKNICLDQISRRIKEIRQFDKPVITCCHSGTRSAMANRLLKKAGIESFDGGAWHKLQKQLS